VNLNHVLRYKGVYNIANLDTGSKDIQRESRIRINNSMLWSSLFGLPVKSFLLARNRGATGRSSIVAVRDWHRSINPERRMIRGLRLQLPLLQDAQKFRFPTDIVSNLIR